MTYFLLLVLIILNFTEFLIVAVLINVLVILLLNKT